MKMPYIKIWIHLVWSTKNRQQMISSELKLKLYQHIRENANEKGIHIDFINGIEEHIHLLVSLKADQSVSKVAQLIKGESSHWVNENKLTRTKFEWQEEYVAVSVSESIVNRIREYIKNQEEHHRRMTFQEEYEMFMKKYGFKYLD